MKTINLQFKTGIIALTVFLTFTVFTNNTSAHCEIPCGIYGDSLRIELIREHIETVEKSMNMINKLSEEEVINYNQLVRWVNNKEDHAIKIQDIVSQYFLHQRIKPVVKEDALYEKYIRELTLLHEILIYAMNAKQTTDLKYIKLLREKVTAFEASYFHEH